jgi:ubiquinone/menaquinone biosynthesis C-methylase UbiE
MHHAEKHFIPAAGHDWALPLYDTLVKLLGFDERRARLLERVELRAGQDVLDIGCGTGTLAVALARGTPSVRVTAVDPDLGALALARRKARRARVEVRLTQSRSEELPHADASFDHVFSSFMFHHLDPHEKRATLRQVRRVLRPTGSLHMLDFRADPEHRSALTRALDAVRAAPKLRGQLEPDVEAMLDDAGFSEPEVETERHWLFGAISDYHARPRPG